MLKVCLTGFTLLFAWSESGQAQTLLVTGSTSPMIVSAAPVAGAEPLAVTDNSTSYVVSALPIAPKKITAQLDLPMPAAVTLTISLASPSGATSLGAVTLDNVPHDVVVNISNTVPESRTITYNLSALVSAGVVAPTSRTVTLTLVNNP